MHFCEIDGRVLGGMQPGVLVQVLFWGAGVCYLGSICWCILSNAYSQLQDIVMQMRTSIEASDQLSPFCDPYPLGLGTAINAPFHTKNLPSVPDWPFRVCCAWPMTTLQGPSNIQYLPTRFTMTYVPPCTDVHASFALGEWAH